MDKQPPRNLGLDLLRVTEAAALTAGRWIGRGKSEEADVAAAEAMKAALDTLDMDGRIVLGEEDKLGRRATLETGVKVGTGYGPAMDVITDPVDGARLLMDGRSGALAVAAVAPRGTMMRLKPAIYMDKIVVDRHVADKLVSECMDAPAAWTLALIARLKNKPIRDMIIFALERDRHTAIIEEIRAAGARVWMRADGDIAGALIAASPDSSVDAMIGIGGTVEGLLAACAVKAVDGAMLARLAPQSVREKESIAEAGLNGKEIFNQNQLVSTHDIFFVATGVTDGPLLKGVRYSGEHAETHSIILRGSTGTRRIVFAEHSIKRLFMGM